MKWVAKRCEESSKGDGSLQIMYGIHGEHELTEVTLDHLDGYKKSRPVRIGNGAYDQVQLDIYGELLDTVYLSNKYAARSTQATHTHTTVAGPALQRCLCSLSPLAPLVCAAVTQVRRAHLV